MSSRKILSLVTSSLFQNKNHGVCKRFYRAAFLAEYGKPLVIEEENKDPHMGHREVLVRVKSAGVNAADLRMTSGNHHLKPILPIIPGFELAGEIEAVGKDVKNFKPGDRVLALKTSSVGAFSEKCAVKEKNVYRLCFKELYKLPHSLSFEIASSLPVAYGTAYIALNDVAKATEGETILVLTAQGASGVAAVDLALNVFRCQVIVGSDTEQKLDFVRPSGVLATVLYTDENLVKNVLRHTNNLGVDIVFDTVGGSCFHQALDCIKPGGQILSVGFSSGEVPSVDLQALMKQRATVHGVWLGGFAQREPDDFHVLISKIIGFLDEQYISPHIGAKFSLDKINEALEFVNKKTSFGKVVLNLD